MALRFDLPASRLTDAQALVLKFARKAERLGFAAPTIAVVDAFTRYWQVTRDGDIVGQHSDRIAPVIDNTSVAFKTYLRSLDMVTVQVTGERPVIAGWQFCAVIEATPEGNMLRKSPNYEADLPLRFRDCTTECDHCNTDRRRNETYVIQHVASGEHKQVGRTCLRDFLANASPEAWMAAYESERQLAEFMGDFDGDGFGGALPSVTTSVFLALVAAHVRLYGFVSAKSAAEESNRMATGIEVFTGVTSKDRDMVRDYFDRVTPNDQALAADAAAWLASDEVGEVTDYVHNLRLAATADLVTHKRANLLASLLPAYGRAVGKRLTAKTAVTNEYLPGAVVKKRLDLVLTLTGDYSFDTDFGRKWILRFADADGRCVVWKTTTYDSEAFGIGDTVSVRGTVKELGEYKGVKQTELTRCKVTPIVEAEPECSSVAA